MNSRNPLRLVLALLAALVVLGVVAALAVKPIVLGRVRAAAHERGLLVDWRRLDVRWPARAEARDLVVIRAATGDTVLAARSGSVSLRVLPLLALRTQPERLALDGVRFQLPPPAFADADTLAPERERSAGDVAPVVRQRAEALVRALLAPARALPTLRVNEAEVTRGGEALMSVAAFALDRDGAATQVALTGTWHGEDDVPFDLLVRWQADDHLTARAQFDVPDPQMDRPEPLVVSFDGRVSQDRRAQELRIAEDSQVRIGNEIAGTVDGLVARAGPRFRLAVALQGLDERRLLASVPRALLGPLAGLELRGSFDWRAGADLDLGKPDSVRFHADVVPHGLALDPALSRPSPGAIAGPFTARILLPHGRVAVREMSALNPHFRPLERISPFLRDAVVTNEDGGFWTHRGFNTEAIGLAVAANLRAGAYQRGAGTITMQLARNLWLGHRRTLSRKAQEVAMAWVVEHLTGLPKERLLELYLNVVEWGPGVHGADEAARYYFGTDAASLTLEQSLFLATILPSPSKWRWRFGPDGSLRPFVRAQMHFIAGKMAAKGRLDPAALAPADSLRVELRGPARARFGTATPADSAGAAPDRGDAELPA